MIKLGLQEWYFILDWITKTDFGYYTALLYVYQVKKRQLSLHTFQNKGFDKSKMNAIPLQLTQEIDEVARVVKHNEKQEKVEKYKYFKCYNCLIESEQNNFCTITYKLLLEGHMDMLNHQKPEDEYGTKYAKNK